MAGSRWETNAAMPDLSLLPPLANLFGVTTDYLLEMDTYQRDLRRVEFDEAYKDYWKADNKEKNYQISLRATAEYPGDMGYLLWLADNEHYVALSSQDRKEEAKIYAMEADGKSEAGRFRFSVYFQVKYIGNL